MPRLTDRIGHGPGKRGNLSFDDGYQDADSAGIGSTFPQ